MYVYYIYIHICTYFDSVSSRHIQNLHYNAYGKTDVFCSISEMSTISRIFLDQQAVFFGFHQYLVSLACHLKFPGRLPKFLESSRGNLPGNHQKRCSFPSGPAVCREALENWMTSLNPREPQGTPGKWETARASQFQLLFVLMQFSNISDRRYHHVALVAPKTGMRLLCSGTWDQVNS